MAEESDTGLVEVGLAGMGDSFALADYVPLGVVTFHDAV